MSLRRRYLATFTLFVLVLAAIVVPVRTSRRAGVTAEYVTPVATKIPPSFVGTATVSILTLDRTTGTAKTSTEITAQATRVPQVNTDEMSFSTAVLPDGSRTWSSVEEKAYAVDDLVTLSGRTYQLVGIKSDQELSAQWIRNDDWFPFDSCEVTLSPASCIGPSAAACPGGVPRVFFAKIRVQLADSFRSAERAVIRVSRAGPETVTIRIERHPFVRFLPIVFFAISGIYVYYLFRYETRKDLVVKSLALFAALWGFRTVLVPQQLTIYPTAIDYGILFVGAATFVLTIIKAELLKGADDEEATSGVTGGIPSLGGRTDASDQEDERRGSADGPDSNASAGTEQG